MWATLKNYAILPQKANGVSGGISSMTVINELPFCATFTAFDRKQVLSLSTCTTRHHQTSSLVVARAARQKLMLCLTEDRECFRYFQAQMRRRGVQTQMCIEQILHHDRALLEDLIDTVISKGVSLSKQQQLSHGIISQKAANEGGQTGGMNLLNNLKGLIIHQDNSDGDEDGTDNDSDEADHNKRKEPANPYAFDDDSLPRNHRRFTMGVINKPQYVVVSTPYQQEQIRRGKRGSLTKLLNKNAAASGPVVEKHCSLEGHDDGKLTFGAGGNGRILRGVGTRSSGATAATVRSSTTSLGFSTGARDSLVSAGEWFSSAILPVPGMRSQSHGTVEPTSFGVIKGQMSRRATASTSSTFNQSANWGQVNMSSRQMSENLQNSLQNVAGSRREYQDFSERGTSATGGMAEFYGSSDLSTSLMGSFGVSQELPVLVENVRSGTRASQKRGGSGLKVALSFCRSAGRTKKISDSMDSSAFEESDRQMSLHESTEFWSSKSFSEDEAEPQLSSPKSCSNKSKSCSIDSDFLAAAAAKAGAASTALYDASEMDSDAEESVLLVGFPSKNKIPVRRENTVIRRRDSSGRSSNVAVPTMRARGA